MNYIYIATTNVSEAIQVLTTITALGYKVWDGTPVTEYANRIVGKCKSFGISLKNKEISGSNSNTGLFHWKDSAATVISYLIPHVTIEILNVTPNHSAIVSIEGIQVGCRKVSFEKFEEIAQAVKNIKEQTFK